MGEPRKVASFARSRKKEQNGCHSGTTKREEKIHFATLMDNCHFKNAELEPKLQKHRERVVLQNDIVKDDSGGHGVCRTRIVCFTNDTCESDVMDVIAHQPDCAAQVPDAVSACTQSNKNGELQERCQIEMIVNLQPVYLLFSDTTKEWKIDAF